ncbi:MAG: AMP-binding protein, partial [Acidiferrobacterales bacterium]|nr:AMP-binding protein [Acidiferrobacterales bacterium]
DHVVLCAPNSVPWVVACLALLEIGAIPIPVDTQASREDLAHILQDSGARWACASTALAAQLVQAQSREDLRLIFMDEEGQNELHHWRRFLARKDADLRTVSPDDCAVLFYTSGTTGPPKGVPLTHRNLSSNIAALLALDIARPDDRLLLPLPLHHVYPFVVGLLSPLALGVAIVIPYSLTGTYIERALNEGRATAILGVPRLYATLCEAIEQRIRAHGRIARALFGAMLGMSIEVCRILGLNIGRWLFARLRRRVGPQVRIVISGGAALEPALAWKLEGFGWQVATGYGLTETSPILTFNLPGAPRFDNAGRPLPGVELRIEKRDPHATLGEVLVKGPNVFSSYHHLPEQSARAFTADGWFRTGDLGYLDNKGFLHLDGRASSMIVLPGGTNVNPEDVEAVLERGRYIKEAGVVEREGRLGVIIVPEPGAVQGLKPAHFEQAVRQDVLEQSRGLASYQQVSKVFIDRKPLPRTRLGKLRRYELVRRYEQIQRTESESRVSSGPLSIDALS